MSFESEREKKTPMNTIQIHRNRAGSKRSGAARRRHPKPRARSAGSVQGKLPAKNTPAKNHQGASRSALGVKYRARCSCTKKNSRKSGSRCAASQCQGTVIARNSGRPHFTCSRRQGAKSREYPLYRIRTATGMAAATRPLVSTPQPAAAHATNIQRRECAAACASKNAAKLKVIQNV